jgi:hypothetical protein
MKVTYHEQKYEVTEDEAPKIQSWLAAREIPKGVYRKIENGKPLQGSSNDVYPDAAARDGYQLVPAAAAAAVAIGERIRIGTGYLNNGSVGIVTGIGDPYDLAAEHGVTDEDDSYDGFRATGWTKTSVRRIYFSREGK